MLPFVFLDESKLGPLQPYGLACAIGFFVWEWAVMRLAMRRGFDRSDFRACVLWVLVLGGVFAWGVDALFYHPGTPTPGGGFGLGGFSSTGGIVGATLGGLIWSRVHIRKEDGRWKASRREKPEFLPATEVIVATWPIAFAFGRLGCALIHDHPGITVAKGTFGSLFAVAWPLGPEDGTHHVLGPLHVVTGGSTARFDLGLLELVVLAGLAIYFATTWNKGWKLGSYTTFAGLTYAPLRFGLDFLREEEGVLGDLRHGGLTFAQYWCLAVIALSLFLLAKRRRPLPAVP
jgi:phosphatidylglycerol:prolipoprotein diacylglycerol transferase